MRQVNSINQLVEGLRYKDSHGQWVVQLITDREIHIYDQETKTVRRRSRSEVAHDIDDGKVFRS